LPGVAGAPEHRLGDGYLARCWGTCLLQQVLLFERLGRQLRSARARQIDGYRVLASWANPDQLGAPQAEPRTVTSQVRQGRRPEASRRPCPVKILATGRQLGRVAN
jgi:hypothetical protein